MIEWPQFFNFLAVLQHRFGDILIQPLSNNCLSLLRRRVHHLGGIKHDVQIEFSVRSIQSQRVICNTSGEDTANDLVACVLGCIQGNLGTSSRRCAHVCYPELGERTQAFRPSSEGLVLLRPRQEAERIAIWLDEDQLVPRCDHVVSAGRARCICLQAQEMVLLGAR